MAFTFDKDISYTHLISKEFDSFTNNKYKKYSIILNADTDKNLLVHIYMIFAPDHYSNFKISNIELE